MSPKLELTGEELAKYRDNMRHSAAHVLAEAVVKLHPEAKLTIGPPIEDGFYYDFDVEQPFTPEDLKAIEKEMGRSIRGNSEFIEREVTREEALEQIKDNPYKVEILEGMQVFGHDHAPRGHMHIKFNNVRVPKENILLGVGRGFEISQVRLGPGRIHHCMRSIGKAEKALELMVKRGASREAFGKPLIKLGKNLEVVSRARIEINAMRLAVLQAAKAMDVLGNKEARVYVSAVKAMVPEKVCEIIDAAIQIHGAAGISQWTPLADLYTDMRHLRFADGPDEVHHMVVGRAEVQKYGLW